MLLRTRALLALSLVATLVVSADVARAQESEPQPLVTVDDASRVARQFERANARNNAGLGVEGQSAIEQPPIQLIDDATFRELRNRGASLGSQGSVAERQVFVPRQTSHPLQFLVSQLVDFGGGATTRQLLVFDQAAPEDDWKVSTAGLLDSPRPPRVLVDPEGWALPVDAATVTGLQVAPDTLAASLAELWTRSDEGQRVSSDLFERGIHTTGAVEQRVAELAAAGVEGNVELAFAAAPYPVVAYRMSRGRALVMFAVAATETIVPAEGARRLVQPESRTTYGGLVVPGRYGSVRYERLVLLTAVVPRAGSPGKVRVIGSYDGTIAATTERVTR